MAELFLLLFKNLSGSNRFKQRDHKAFCNAQTIDDVIEKLKHAKYFAVFDTSECFFHVPFEPKTKPVMSLNANFKHAPTHNPVKVTNVKCTGKANLIGKEIDVRKPNSSNSMYKMCSGHISKPVARLITQM